MVGSDHTPSCRSSALIKVLKQIFCIYIRSFSSNIQESLTNTVVFIYIWLYILLSHFVFISCFAFSLHYRAINWWYSGCIFLLTCFSFTLPGVSLRPELSVMVHANILVKYCSTVPTLHVMTFMQLIFADHLQHTSVIYQIAHTNVKSHIHKPLY